MNALGKPDLSDRPSDGPLPMGFVEVIPSQFFRIGDGCQCLCRKEPLPDQFLRRVPVLFLHSVLKKGSGITGIQVFLMNLLHLLKMGIQFLKQRLWKRYGPVLFPLAVMDCQYPCIKVEIGYAEL